MTCYCVILGKCCYTREDTRLSTHISNVFLPTPTPSHSQPHPCPPPHPPPSHTPHLHPLLPHVRVTYLAAAHRGPALAVGRLLTHGGGRARPAPSHTLHTPGRGRDLTMGHLFVLTQQPGRLLLDIGCHCTCVSSGGGCGGGLISSGCLCILLLRGTRPGGGVF